EMDRGPGLFDPSGHGGWRAYAIPCPWEWEHDRPVKQPDSAARLGSPLNAADLAAALRPAGPEPAVLRSPERSHAHRPEQGGAGDDVRWVASGGGGHRVQGRPQARATGSGGSGPVALGTAAADDARGAGHGP